MCMKAILLLLVSGLKNANRYSAWQSKGAVMLVVEQEISVSL